MRAAFSIMAAAAKPKLLITRKLALPAETALKALAGKYDVVYHDSEEPLERETRLG